MHNNINERPPVYLQIRKELSSTGLKFLGHNLKLVSIDANLRLSCPICFVDFHDNSKVSRLKCRHVYHSECLEQLIIQTVNKSCAICRETIKIIDTQDTPISLVSVWTEIKYFSMKLGYIHIKLQDTGF
jgi:hypothetical protein